MLILRTHRFKKDFQNLSMEIQNKVGKVLEQFLKNSRYPSLHTKKMQGACDLWELRVDLHYRITFQWVEGNILLRRVGPHDVLKHP